MSHRKVRIGKGRGKRIGDPGILTSLENKSQGSRHSIGSTDVTIWTGTCSYGQVPPFTLTPPPTTKEIESTNECDNVIHQFPN